MINEGSVTTSVENGIARIEFYHPKGNSLPGLLLEKLTNAINELSNNPDAKVIVLQSKGGAFCAGASFDELILLDNFDSAKKFFLGFANVILAMVRCPKFIIGRIHGKAVGGGVGLVSACDYSIACDSAAVRLSELALGVGPSVIGPAVERKLGKGAFTSMTIDQDWHAAEWAYHKGLYSKVVSAENLDQDIELLANKLALNSPEAMRKLKAMFWEDAKYWDELLDMRAEISGRLVLSDFTKNYIKEFKEK